MVTDISNTNKRISPVLILLVLFAGFTLLVPGFATTITNTTRMTVFVTNSAPVVIFANVTPNPATPGQTLTYRANITDVNGDTLTVTIRYYNTTKQLQGSALGAPKIGNFYTNNTFTLSATAASGTWYVNATITDGFTTIVNKTVFTVNAVVSTRLQNTPVDFGNQTANTIAQRAENGTALTGRYKGGAILGFPLIINNTGNSIVNYTINGTDLVGPSKTIGVNNVTWNTSITAIGTRAGKTQLTKTTPVLINKSVAAGAARRVFFYIDTPRGITQQRLNGTIKIVTNTQ